MYPSLSWCPMSPCRSPQLAISAETANSAAPLSVGSREETVNRVAKCKGAPAARTRKKPREAPRLSMQEGLKGEFTDKMQSPDPGLQLPPLGVRWLAIAQKGP